MAEKGGISVQTEHIFPIIKRWLYSEKEIFLRELVSNACDAVAKLKHLVSIGEAQGIGDDFQITVKADKEKNTLTITDNGIGMTEEDVKKYINQIALSGALDFIQKYDNAETEKEANPDGIIGHFGLGFYSAFMVADEVEIQTKSFTGAPAVSWKCSDDGDYEMAEGARAERGTDIILHIAEEEKEYLDNNKLRSVLEKYCAFMATPIYLAEEKKEEDSGEQKPINDADPLWLKNPSQCTEEEYKEFYRKAFHDYKEPLFSIHINADYPLNFKGILYFPKISHEYETLEGQVKLFYNRVFVADNIKEIIPEYLLMLKGVVDCPELPLNVSRSSLQTNSYVAKVSAHITKKVCDKLNALFNTDREKYESFYEDLKTFVEYACLRERKFFEKVHGIALFKTVDGEYLTLRELLGEKADSEEEKKIYYTDDPTRQALYVNLFKKEGVKIVVLNSMIDTNFISLLEQEEKNLRFFRVDADSDAIKTDAENAENENFQKLFQKVSGNEKLKVSVTELKDETVPAVLNLSEESRRFNDMMKMYARVSESMPGSPLSEESTLLLNRQNSLIHKIETLAEDAPETAETIAKQIYLLTLMGQRQLTADELSGFVSNSFGLLEKL